MILYLEDNYKSKSHLRKLRTNKYRNYFLSFFYNYVVSSGSAISVKVTLSFHLLTKNVMFKIYTCIYKLPFYPSRVGEILRLSAQRSIQTAGFLDGGAREYSMKAEENGITRQFIIFTVLQIVLGY
jgi:hypothetical protein